MKRAGFAWIPLILLLAACGQPASDSAPGILTSTTFLADIVRNVAGDRVSVESLLPAGSDPHSFQPTPRDAGKIERSGLLVINGVEYEHFLESLLENAGGERQVIEASADIPWREDAGGDHGIDPHMWLDPNLVMI